jgi:16S rRNA (guanine527-N7)-methyltransferase
MHHPDLIETLRLAQRLGFFGARPIEAAVQHAEAFVAAIGPLPAGSRVVDLGSGGGLPGLVVAAAYPQVAVLLVDRRSKRTDFLLRAVRRLGFDHVSVRAGDVSQLVGEVAEGVCPLFDVVTARGFGPPDATLRTAVALLGRTGRIVISEPPSGDRWNPELLSELGVRGERHGPVGVFRFT